MADICTYCIEVKDQLDEQAYNATSPQQIKVLRAGQESTMFTICADQAGLIGLLRQLHGYGFTLLTVACQQ
jgi:hypothetical protein